MFGIGKAAIAIAVASTAAVGTTVAVTSTAETAADQAVVTNLVDGDTIDVAIDGGITRIRLLNIDTPETKDPNEDVQCLGPEAAAFLASLIPIGTPVRLEYDQVRTDPFDRTLAGVFTTNGVLVNAEVARQGLATAVIYDGNERFYPPVVEARDEAIEARRGLFATDIACTVPARVAAVAAAAAAAPGADAYGPTAASVELDRSRSVVAEVAAQVAALEDAFASAPAGHSWEVLPDAERDRLATDVRVAREAVDRKDAELRDAAEQARDREAAEAAEQARLDEEAAAREAAEREAAEREAAERRRREEDAAQAEQNRRQRDSGGSGSGSGGGGCEPGTPRASHHSRPTWTAATCPAARTS